MNRNVNICSILILALLLLACNRNNNESLVIRPVDSPATGDSREPELTTTAGGRIILSWVEKVGEKRYALRDKDLLPRPCIDGEGRQHRSGYERPRSIAEERIRIRP